MRTKIILYNPTIKETLEEQQAQILLELAEMKGAN